MTKTDVLKMRVVVKCIANAIETISQYCEEPPPAVDRALSFIKQSHDFLLSAAIMSGGDKEEIASIPDKVKRMWDAIDLNSLGVENDDGNEDGNDNSEYESDSEY